MIVLLRRLLWFVTLPSGFRREAIRHGIFRQSRRRSDEGETPRLRLLIGSRDRRIVENLAAFYRDYGQTDVLRYAGIVFGAAHMPAIGDGLRQLGFQVGTRRWVEVMRIPAAGNGGK
jgi:hypothetical protein